MGQGAWGMGWESLLSVISYPLWVKSMGLGAWSGGHEVEEAVVCIGYCGFGFVSHSDVICCGSSL